MVQYGAVKCSKVATKKPTNEYTMSLENNILLTLCAGLFGDACVLYRDVPVTGKKRNTDNVCTFNKRKKLPEIYITRPKNLVDTVRKLLEDPMRIDL